MQPPLRIIFAGTPEFAKVACEALIHSAHQLIAVYTQPDRPSGRGQQLKPSPVKCLALAHQLPLYQPASLRDQHAQEELAALKPDVMVVAAYGLLLPELVLSLPRYGCINIHPSLLPRWRGAAPIQRTIEAGDEVTGVSIMHMEVGLDTGPVLLQRSYTLASDETSASLHDRLAILGSEALLKTLDLLQAQALNPHIQDHAQAIYAHKILKEEALINWEDEALRIDRKIRAFVPWPVAYTSWQGQSLRIYEADVLAESPPFAPGTLYRASEQGIEIVTGKGVLRLLRLQLPGGKILSAADFYHARQHLLVVGKHFL